jgi:hypothetical protein
MDEPEKIVEREPVVERHTTVVTSGGGGGGGTALAAALLLIVGLVLLWFLFLRGGEEAGTNIDIGVDVKAPDVDLPDISPPTNSN